MGIILCGNTKGAGRLTFSWRTWVRLLEIIITEWFRLRIIQTYAVPPCRLDIGGERGSDHAEPKSAQLWLTRYVLLFHIITHTALRKSTNLSCSCQFRECWECTARATCLWGANDVNVHLFYREEWEYQCRWKLHVKLIMAAEDVQSLKPSNASVMARGLSWDSLMCAR